MTPQLAVKKKKAKRKAGLQLSTEPPGAPAHVVFFHRAVAYLTARLTRVVAVGLAAAPAEQPQPAPKSKKKRRMDVAPQQAAVLVWHGMTVLRSPCQGGR